MIERQWKLGEDVLKSDGLLDGFTFDQLIISLRSGSRNINPKEVERVANEMLESQLEDFRFLLENNMQEIISAALEGRVNYED